MTAYVVLLIIAITAGFYKMLEKAGIPGWKAFIPVYGKIMALRLIGRPDWWLLLLLIPLVNIVVSVMMAIEMAERFGRGVLFGAGLTLLPFIFYPILGFGNARYSPPDRGYSITIR